MAALAAALMSADASVLAMSGPLSPATAGKGADAQVDLTPMPYSPPKLSFSNPYKAYVGGNIPGWEYGGETSLNNDYMMLTTATSNKLGWIWTTEPIEIDDWEVQLEFHIGGDPRQSTGGGMAVWFTEQQGRAGAMYGQSDDFRGVGILFDSYGGGESGERVEPFVVAVLNDGTSIDEGAHEQAPPPRTFSPAFSRPHPALARQTRGCSRAAPLATALSPPLLRAPPFARPACGVCRLAASLPLRAMESSRASEHPVGTAPPSRPSQIRAQSRVAFCGARCGQVPPHHARPPPRAGGRAPGRHLLRRLPQPEEHRARSHRVDQRPAPRLTRTPNP